MSNPTPTRPRLAFAASVTVLLHACGGTGPGPGDGSPPARGDGGAASADAATTPGPAPTRDGSAAARDIVLVAPDGGEPGYACPAGAPAAGTTCGGSTVRAGLTCTSSGAGGAQATCSCLGAMGMMTWRCGEGLCPALPETGSPCAQRPEVQAAGACRYIDQSECHCSARLMDANQLRWSCNAAAARCGTAPRSGACGYAPEGATCRFHGADMTCVCQREPAGDRRWYCNGARTPDCPTGLSGSGGDCAGFPAGAICLGAGTATCTCRREGTRQTWQCSG